MRLAPLTTLACSLVACGAPDTGTDARDTGASSSDTDADTDTDTDADTDSDSDTDADTDADTATDSGYPLFGSYPTTVTEADARGAYDAWKSAWVSPCDDGTLRVLWDDPSRTVSEGIGYGMLLAASWEDQATFDGLWAYYEAHRNTNGLMGWKGGCGYNDDEGAASDADLDVAMALVMADCRWPGTGYLDHATGVLAALRSTVLHDDGGHTLLCAGDNWGGECCGNPSYQAPAWYRVFGGVTGDPDFWDGAAEDTYYYLDKYGNDTTGLVPDWMDPDTLRCDSHDAWDWYGWDASRVPWRVVVDYAWHGTPEAATYAQTIATFVADKGGPADTCTGYLLDGSGCGGPAQTAFAGAFAASALAADPATVDAFFGELGAVSNVGYFNETLEALYLATAVGRFTPVCR